MWVKKKGGGSNIYENFLEKEKQKVDIKWELSNCVTFFIDKKKVATTTKK